MNCKSWKYGQCRRVNAYKFLVILIENNIKKQRIYALMLKMALQRGDKYPFLIF